MARRPLPWPCVPQSRIHRVPDGSRRSSAAISALCCLSLAGKVVDGSGLKREFQLVAVQADRTPHSAASLMTAAAAAPSRPPNHRSRRVLWALALSLLEPFGNLGVLLCVGGMVLASFLEWGDSFGGVGESDRRTKGASVAGVGVPSGSSHCQPPVMPSLTETILSAAFAARGSFAGCAASGCDRSYLPSRTSDRP